MRKSTPVADMVALADARQAVRYEQPNRTAAYAIVLALLAYGLWPHISPYIPDSINPAPIASPFGDSVDGLHVMLVYPTEGNLTREQDIVVNSTRLRELVDRDKFRALDPDTEFQPTEKLWADTMAKFKTAMPGKLFGIVVGNKGKGGTITDFPATEDAAAELLNKYK